MIDPSEIKPIRKDMFYAAKNQKISIDKFIWQANFYQVFKKKFEY